MDVVDRLAGDADEIVVAQTPVPFSAIGQFYLDFTQISDAEVTECLGEVLEPQDHEVQA